MQKFLLTVTALMSSVLMTGSCHRDPDMPAGPHIASFAPDAGAKASTVIITGTGFGTVASDHVVTFNGKAATVLSATATTLTVQVPTGAGSGKIAVHMGNEVDSTGNDFVYYYTVTTLAGTGISGFADGAGTVAQFAHPYAVAADAAGNVYVADNDNNRIRKITSTGEVSTLAGNGTPGLVDGTGTDARFSAPKGIAVDAAGNVYVADTYNYSIRKISTLANGTGVVTTMAGNGTPGFANGPGQTAMFSEPYGVATDAAGNVYVGDVGNNRIRKIVQAANGTTVVTTLAGEGAPAFEDGPAANAQFNYPAGVATDAAGNVYVADAANYRIRKIIPLTNGTSTVITLAGTGDHAFADGPAATAKFDVPQGVAVDAAGNVYVADILNGRIRKIMPLANGTGIVSSIGGTGTGGLVNGIGHVAQFFFPTGVATNASGIVYVADYNNNVIRKLE
jgi:hypothetical protein